MRRRDYYNDEFGMGPWDGLRYIRDADGTIIGICNGFVEKNLGPEPDHDLMRSNPPRTRASYPYSYDPFTIYGRPYPNKKCNGTDYTDRLEQWNYQKYQKLAKEIYRSYSSEYERPFDSYNCRGDLIERFLRQWHEDPKLELLRVIEYCNPSTGYQTWRLDYYSPKEAERAAEYERERQQRKTDE